ncbi:GIY-YIG nuclease family protein [Pedobacter cryotolerans]|uniref:GIY-YIG nuclease family protein n=1 Tax=Pedobacter cryotolerans TaxID=2571270 RepID=A0A4U1CDI8_9SPHI|nr:GIY-YIG nuclease family protein [Pedobacter cryotolerans]TKC02064.1 GIY-YIG nuclease family protein [Pedobacter cryotolerans]
MGKGGYVYIMTNEFNSVYYTGVTSDLRSGFGNIRIAFILKSFTSRYKCYKLVYYQSFFSIEEAIDEEKRIKGGNRQSKINLVKGLNPEWLDLFETID